MGDEISPSLLPTSRVIFVISTFDIAYIFRVVQFIYMDFYQHPGDTQIHTSE
jgi:hypothetical protein